MSSEEIDITGIKIPKADWDATPASIQALVRVLSERLWQLEEKVNQNSQNSSKPPSRDEFDKPAQRKSQHQPPRRSKPSKRPRQVRKLYPIESCAHVHEVIPEICSGCGAQLRGNDPHPHRHQVIELPPIVPQVYEYRLHQLACDQCRCITRASLPVGVSSFGYGEHLSAVVALLSGTYRQSHRQVCRLMGDLFGVQLSRGGVARLRQEMSEALRETVSAAKDYVQVQGRVNVDETSFPQGNRDRLNPKGSKGWLWVLVTPLVSFFEVSLSRSQATAQELIGKTFAGIVISDRYSAYHWLELNRWQVCWAHLKRDLQAMAERSGVSKEIGESLLARERRLFQWWHRVRDGTWSRATFIECTKRLRAGFKAELEAAAALPISKAEKTPLAKTVRTCRKLLKVEPALWTFVYHLEIEPTNNDAERALRPAVIWRHTSFGSQSRSGSEFVARMLTVTASLRAQNRSVIEFLCQTCKAHRSKWPKPSLIPEAMRSPIPLFQETKLLAAS